MTDPYDITARLEAIRKRIAARLPEVTGLGLEVHGDGKAVVSGNGRVLAMILLQGTDDEIVSGACQILAESLRVLPEVVLAEDTSVSLSGHKLVVADLMKAVQVSARPPVDPTHGYTAEMGEADVERLAKALAQAFVDGSKAGHVELPEVIEALRGIGVAPLLLSKLHCFKIGAPPESPGHAAARAVHDLASMPPPVASVPGQIASPWDPIEDGGAYRWRSPRPVGGHFHDHWVARIAESGGEWCYESDYLCGTANTVEEAKREVDDALVRAGWRLMDTLVLA